MNKEAQPNFIAKALLPERLTAHRQAAGNVHPRSASRDSIDVIQEISLHVRIGDSIMQATFHIMDKLAVNILLRTSLIDENIHDILQRAKTWVPRSSKLVSIQVPKTTDTEVNVSRKTASEAAPARVTASKTQVELCVKKQNIAKPKGYRNTQGCTQTSSTVLF